MQTPCRASVKDTFLSRMLGVLSGWHENCSYCMGADQIEKNRLRHDAINARWSEKRGVR
ncbi:hypothetical protein JOE21_000603 [Desmospora profundinema]|uniref:Uncharacterized protein n=1 Tax=Desmospora profundinema TaxID=1571184 RepID=A0ABU1IIL7_9BACL|nr:hypothetical protein [Desmospora profundinema]